MSVREARAKIDFREFLHWQVYLSEEIKDQYRREWKGRHREDVYLARIAWEVYVLQNIVANLMSKKKLVIEKSINDFLLPIRTRKKSPTLLQTLPPAERVRAEKAMWFASVGYTPSNN